MKAMRTGEILGHVAILGLVAGIGALAGTSGARSQPKVRRNFRDPSSFGGECGYYEIWMFHDPSLDPSERKAVLKWEREIIKWVRDGKPGSRPKGPGLDLDEEFIGERIEACHTRLMYGDLSRFFE